MGFTATSGFVEMDEQEEHRLPSKRHAFHTSYGEFSPNRYQNEAISREPIYYGSDDQEEGPDLKHSSSSSDNYDDLLDIASHQLQSRIADSGHSYSDYRMEPVRPPRKSIANSKASTR